MYKIKIVNEYLHGPIWVYNSDGIAVWNPPLLTQDSILSDLNGQVMETYSSYYEFNSHGQICWFNQEKEQAEKGIMLDLITRIIERLNQLNDGAFVVEDYETERLRNL